MKKKLQTGNLALVPMGDDAGVYVARHKRAANINKRIHMERRCSCDRRQSVRFEKTRRSTMDRRYNDRQKHVFGAYGQ